MIKPLIGPSRSARPTPRSSARSSTATAASRIACGLAPHIDDPYDMAIAAIDEAIRNAVAVGADPDQIAILDNFCWPSVDDEKTMGTLVRACEACRDAALAYGIPFISGKDSLHNQFTNSRDRRGHPHPQHAADQRDRRDRRRAQVRDDGPEEPHRHACAWSRPRDRATSTTSPRRTARGRSRSPPGGSRRATTSRDGGVAVAAAEMCIASGLGLIVGEEHFMTDDASPSARPLSRRADRRRAAATRFATTSPASPT